MKLHAVQKKMQRSVRAWRKAKKKLTQRRTANGHEYTRIKTEPQMNPRPQGLPPASLIPRTMEDKTARQASIYADVLGDFKMRSVVEPRSDEIFIASRPRYGIQDTPSAEGARERWSAQRHSPQKNPTPKGGGPVRPRPAAAGRQRSTGGDPYLRFICG
jgi:hypothetical protein